MKKQEKQAVDDRSKIKDPDDWTTGDECWHIDLIVAPLF
jgi:hemolysin-activating ACP:hemolysin acyltransferase